MPAYVYTCKKHPKVRKEVTHGMNENPIVLCPECRCGMHRKPQSFRFYMNPYNVLLDKLDDGFNDFKRRKGKRNAN
jgi:hypothetical protein